MSRSYSEDQKLLLKQWEKGNLTFEYWNFVKNEDLQTKLEGLPENLFQKSTFMEDQADKDIPAETTDLPGVKATQQSLQLFLKSADNPRSEVLQDSLDGKLERGIDWVSTHLRLQRHVSQPTSIFSYQILESFKTFLNNRHIRTCFINIPV